MSSVTRTDISDVVLLVASRSAFAALKSDGDVVVWGTKHSGGVLSTETSSALSKMTQHIVASETGFVGYTTSDVIVSWGYAGSVSGVSNVVYVAHSSTAFAALKSDNTVVAWGKSTQGGDADSVSDLLVDIASVASTDGAFAALTTGGSVVAWGDSGFGGQLFANVSSTMGVTVSLSSTNRAFAAVSSSGAVTVWGSKYNGGEISTGVLNELSSGVKMMCSSDISFTAIKTDGTAYYWRDGSDETELTGDFSIIESC